MYSEIHRSGIKQFLYALAEAAAASVVSLVIKFIFREIPLIGDIATVAIFSALVYCVYVHYTAVFEYSIDGHNVTVMRTIGHRKSTIGFKTSQISSVLRSDPPKMHISRRCISILRPKNPLYIIYGSKGVMIDGSEELYDKLKIAMNGDKKWQK